MTDHKGDSHSCRNLEASNPGATKPIFWTYLKICFYNICLGHSLEDRKSKFCHAAVKKFVAQEISSYREVQIYKIVNAFQEGKWYIVCKSNHFVKFQNHFVNISKPQDISARPNSFWVLGPRVTPLFAALPPTATETAA